MDYKSLMDDSMTTTINDYQARNGLGRWPAPQKERRKVLSVPLLDSYYQERKYRGILRDSGIRPSRFSDILAGADKPTLEQLSKICRTLGIEIDDLMVEVDYE